MISNSVMKNHALLRTMLLLGRTNEKIDYENLGYLCVYDWYECDFTEINPCKTALLQAFFRNYPSISVIVDFA